MQHRKMVEVLTGHDIRVEFDRPTPPQIDGETVPDVTEYAVTGNEKPPPFAVVAADRGFLERNRRKGYLLLR